MKKVIALFMVLLALGSCTSEQQAEKKGTAFEQYTDSITKVYPNYAGNIAVAKQICGDFEKHLGTMPGILEGSEFTLDDNSIAEIDGKILVMFSYKYKGENITSLSVYCEDLDPQLASTLNSEKPYKITGGTFDHYEPVHGMAAQWLQLGTVYVRDLKVEEM